MACNIAVLPAGSVVFEDVGTEYFTGQVLKPIDKAAAAAAAAAAVANGSSTNGSSSLAAATAAAAAAAAANNGGGNGKFGSSSSSSNNGVVGGPTGGATAGNVLEGEQGIVKYRGPNRAEEEVVFGEKDQVSLFSWLFHHCVF